MAVSSKLFPCHRFSTIPFLPLRGLAERPQIKSPPATCFVLSGFTSLPLSLSPPLLLLVEGEIRGLFKRDPRMEVCHRDLCIPPSLSAPVESCVSLGTVTRGLLNNRGKLNYDR